MTYNWQQPDWPHFRYDLSELHKTLLSIAEKTGFIAGKLAHLSENQQTEALINIVVDEAVKTSEIEGEYINRQDVRSSVINKLGLEQKIIKIHDKRAQGVVDMMFDVRNTFKQPLTQSKLLEWHKMLLSETGDSKLEIGHWRTHKEAMTIVSGHYKKQQVHFEAPPSKNVPKEMEKFILWFNNTAPGKPDEIKFAPARAAIAHLYFESIHPFEDGNGRIGRAISEKALSQGFGYPAMLSLSQSIEAERKAYYMALNLASKSNEITAWLHYFVDIVLQSQIAVESNINFILKKTVFFDGFKNHLNDRQLKVIRRMMQSGEKIFEGGMTAKKYMGITGASKATATRDLQTLVELKAFKQMEGGGRNVHYELNLS
jgi:Fic family protein